MKNILVFGSSTKTGQYIKRIYNAAINSNNTKQDSYYGERYSFLYQGNYNLNLDNSIVFGLEREDDSIGYNKNINQLVSHQVKLAKKANLDAVVCSAHEVKIVKKFFKKEIITPGIRFNTKADDQKRVLTPKQAYKNGSDWLVIGRPITKGNIKKNIQSLVDHLSKWSEI